MSGSRKAGKKKSMLRERYALIGCQRHSNGNNVGKVDWNYGSELDC